MTALRLLIFVTPIESEIVTTVASPSGIAATARLTATMNVFRTSSGVMPLFAVKRLKPNIKMHMPMTMYVKIRLSWPSLICRGVCPLSAFVSASAILPISVFIPVSVTTANAVP